MRQDAGGEAVACEGQRRDAGASARLRAAGLMAALVVASCSSLDTRPNAGPCPMVGVLGDAGRLVELNGAERHENVVYTGDVEGARGFCRYVDAAPIEMELEVDFALGKGPLAGDEERTYRYFVAVTRRDRVVLAKETFDLPVRFAKGADVVRVRDKVEGIVIPRANDTVSGANFEVLVGFELTPEQLQFNRDGKRFRIQVK